MPSVTRGPNFGTQASDGCSSPVQGRGAAPEPRRFARLRAAMAAESATPRAIHDAICADLGVRVGFRR